MDETRYQDIASDDCHCTEFPVCPHCKKADQDWWDSPRAPHETEWEMFCGWCEGLYKVEMENNPRFTTKAPK